MSNSTIKDLIRRRAALQLEYNRLITQPESYSITGSVSATNRKLEDIQKQIDTISQQITQLASGSGIKRSLPNYN